MAAITSTVRDDLYPTEVLVEPPEGGLARPSLILLNQIRSVDRRRLVSRLGRLSGSTMARVDRALALALGLAGL